MKYICKMMKIHLNLILTSVKNPSFHQQQLWHSIDSQSICLTLKHILVLKVLILNAVDLFQISIWIFLLRMYLYFKTKITEWNKNFFEKKKNNFAFVSLLAVFSFSWSYFLDRSSFDFTRDELRFSSSSNFLSKLDNLSCNSCFSISFDCRWNFSL